MTPTDSQIYSLGWLMHGPITTSAAMNIKGCDFYGLIEAGLATKVVMPKSQEGFAATLSGRAVYCDAHKVGTLKQALDKEQEVTTNIEYRSYAPSMTEAARKKLGVE